MSVEYLDAAMIQIGVPTVLLVLASVAFVVFNKKGDEKKASLCVQFMIVFTFLIFMSTSNKVSADDPLPPYLSDLPLAAVLIPAMRVACVSASICFCVRCDVPWCSLQIFSVLNCKRFADGR